MKKIFLFTVASLFYYFSSAQVTVGADQSLKVSLNDYSTYAWTAGIDKIPEDQVFIGLNGVYIFNNESVRSKIKNAIEYELSAKGYQKSEANPDMLVLFLVTEQPGTLRTYNGYQIVNGGLDTVRTEENVQKTHIDAGTLLINLIDAKSGKVAWQGYASGILKPDMINDDSKVRAAVSSIFSKFDYKANK